MASSGGSLSFTDLLGNTNLEMNQEKIPFSWGLSDVEIPKYKSFQPTSLPISSPLSPSSYLAANPPSFSPSLFLDSPVLFSSSNVLPSPTTGTFASLANGADDRKYSDFSFLSHTNSGSSSSLFPSTDMKNSSEKLNAGGKSELVPIQSFSQEVSRIQAIKQSNSTPPQVNQKQYAQQSQRKAEDGYNWRKYGQKQVKGSDNPRSYYKCSFPSCPMKKKIEQNWEGHITEIVYKGNHNHPKPQSTRRSSSSFIQNPAYNNNVGISNQSNGLHDSSRTTSENSSASFGDDDFDQGSTLSNPVYDNETEPEAKRWKGEIDNEGIQAQGSRTVREPRVVVQTTSDIDILDDGYRWRKYGQKVVRGNPNPRSYYKCTYNGCPVRKHVERASHDLRAVITTYEGKHNHDVPAARGSSSYNTRPSMNNAPTVIRPSAMNGHSNNVANFPNSVVQTTWPQQTKNQADNFAFSGFSNSVGTYPNQMQQTDNALYTAKEEPKEDSFFNSFLN